MTPDLDPRWKAALDRHRTATGATPDAWAGITARADGDAVVAPPGRARRLVAAATILVLAGVVGVVAVVADDPPEVTRAAAPTSTTTTAASPAPPGDPIVTGTGRVVEDATGTHLCGGYAEALVGTTGPPTCGQIPLVGWDWGAVSGEVTEGGTTSIASVRVVGTYDGETITVTDEPPPGTATPSTEPDPVDTGPRGIPCPTPAGGWRVTDPTKVALADYLAFRSAAETDPQYAGMWVDEAAAPPYGVYVVAFTADLDRHRAELAALYGGPICVTEGDVSAESLAAAQDALIALDPQGDGIYLDGFHLDVTGFGPDGGGGALSVMVVFAAPGAEAALSDALGVPVAMTSFLRQIG